MIHEWEIVQKIHKLINKAEVYQEKGYIFYGIVAVVVMLLIALFIIGCNEKKTKVT